MKELQHYLDKVKGHIEKEHEVANIMYCALKKLKSHDEEDYDFIMAKLHLYSLQFHCL